MLGLAAQARAQGSVEDRARAAYERGVEAARAGSYARALEAFEEAYRLRPAPRLLYNIGEVARFVPDWARSYEAFEQYLREGDAGSIPGRREEVEEALRALGARVARVTVVSKVAGAELFVDGARVALPLARPLVLTPGPHDLAVRAKGLVEARRTLVARAGQDLQLELTPTPATPREAAPASRPALWVGWGVTALFSAASGATSLAAVARDGELGRTSFVGPGSTPSPGGPAARLRDEVQALAISADVLLGAAAVTGLTTLLVRVTQPKAAPKRGASDALVLRF